MVNKKVRDVSGLSVTELVKIWDQLSHRARLKVRNHLGFEKYFEIYNLAKKRKPTPTLRETKKIVRYFGNENAMHNYIAVVLMQLPSPVRKFVAKNCVFFSCYSNEPGFMVPLKVIGGKGRQLTRRLIFITNDILEYISDKGICNLIAHEIAHAYLRHQGTDGLHVPERNKMEYDAGVLAAEWGFPRPKKYEYVRN